MKRTKWKRTRHPAYYRRAENPFLWLIFCQERHFTVIYKIISLKQLWLRLGTTLFIINLGWYWNWIKIMALFFWQTIQTINRNRNVNINRPRKKGTNWTILDRKRTAKCLHATKFNFRKLQAKSRKQYNFFKSYNSQIVIPLNHIIISIVYVSRLLIEKFFLIGTQFLLTLIGNSQQKELIVIPHQEIFLNDITSKKKGATKSNFNWSCWKIGL